MTNKVYFFKVASATPLFKTLTYQSVNKIPIGQRVQIPFRNRIVNGLIMEEDLKQKPAKNIKHILKIDSLSLPLSKLRLQWISWMSKYYHYPLGLVAELHFSQKNFLKKSINTQEICKKPFESKLQLNTEQQNCVQNILKSKGFCVHLIHGVTGSGKTEVYKKLISHFLDQDLQVLILIPEIFLTSQIIHRFSQSFPQDTALLHSQISQKQKRQYWQELILAKKKLLVGTRSALFCPLPKLACIIIDEEHDTSFKQEDKFRYHARDSSIVLSKMMNIPIVLGSATPDLSTYQQATKGHYKLHELKKRAFKQSLPQVSVVDLKNSSSQNRPFWLSDLLFEKIQNTLKQNKQVALFMNRRGQASSMICVQCGEILKCLNCDISLTLHKDLFLLCHYCSFYKKKDSICSFCKGRQWLEKGLGTQKITQVMQEYFPKHRILRADRDSLQSHEDIKNCIHEIENKKAHIIVGTQMLSKGLNFPSLYLVAFILADMDFHFPDFRSGEKAFQTLIQMSGRAGRESHGEVVIQTFNPNHPSILFAKNHDYKGFFQEDIKNRQNCNYPPFSRICLLHIDSLKEDKARLFAQDLAKQSRLFAHSQIQILGPSSAPLIKLKNRYRFQILIKAKTHFVLEDFLQALIPKIKKTASIQVKIDRDPLSLS